MEPFPPAGPIPGPGHPVRAGSAGPHPVRAGSAGPAGAAAGTGIPALAAEPQGAGRLPAGERLAGAPARRARTGARLRHGGVPAGDRQPHPGPVQACVGPHRPGREAPAAPPSRARTGWARAVPAGAAGGRAGSPALPPGAPGIGWGRGRARTARPGSTLARCRSPWFIRDHARPSWFTPDAKGIDLDHRWLAAARPARGRLRTRERKIERGAHRPGPHVAGHCAPRRFPVGRPRTGMAAAGPDRPALAGRRSPSPPPDPARIRTDGGRIM